VLDLLLFGRLKSAKQYLPRNQELDPQVDHTTRVCRAYEIATICRAIRESSEKAGFAFVKRHDTYDLWINEDKIPRDQNFRRLGALITRRRGCLNEDANKSGAG
jgi:hypothetical protein